MMDIRERILEILEEMHPDIDFNQEEELVSKKILDSFDLVSLVSELSDEFDVEITARDFIEDNFNSLDRLTNMIIRLTGD